MRMCNVTLVEITEALARKCPSAIEAALGIFLAIMAGGGRTRGWTARTCRALPSSASSSSIPSLEATAPVEVERIRLLDDVLRQKLTASSRFEIVDIPPDTIKDWIGTHHQQLQRLPAQVRADGRRELGRVG